MVFSSVTFLFYFLPIFLAAYFLLPFKNSVLLIASLLFYAWGEAGYVLLLLVSICVNFFFGLNVEKHSHNNKKQKIFLFIGIAINLLLLGYYKYFNFLADVMLSQPLENKVHLPLGISFFTFQSISYLVDVYRKEAKVEKNIFNLALYISMFPQLVAGPIVRFKSIAEQIHKRSIGLDQTILGIKIFIIGLAQKTLLANQFAEPADAIFGLTEATLTTSVAWLGAICYSFQIYFDFAGYSNMAIGLGLIMGFSFPKNFNYPYISQSITEFWRRWHMSLSSWFRDYLYIPLGGNRISSFRTYLNLMIVFLLCGLWHGAAWTFIIWGFYHGFFLIIERYKLNHVLKQSPKAVRHIYAILVFIFGWVIFRSENFDQLNYFMKAMFAAGSGETNEYTASLYLSNSLISVIVIGTIFSLPIYQNILGKLNELKDNAIKYFTANAILETYYILILILSIISVGSGSYNPFIYFRF